MNRCKNFALSTAGMLACCTLSQIANAADAPGSASARQLGSIKDSGAYGEPSPTSWQGLYLGLTLGYNGSGVDIKNVGGNNDTDLDSNAISIAPFIGYNFSHGPWVWGVEADLGGVGLDDKQQVAGLGTVSASTDWFGSMRLRGGYAWDRVLVYATAGIAFTELKVSSSLGGNESSWETGVAFGAGAEYALDNAWTARAEVLGYAFDDDEITLAGAKRDIALGHGTARIGISRKF